MSTLFTVVAVTAGLFNLGSGIASMLRVKIIYPLLDGANVPHSWLVFPIGVLKTAGGAGILIGLLGVPWIGTAAAIGLILFWTCAIYTHVMANFWPKETVLTFTFFTLSGGTLTAALV